MSNLASRVLRFMVKRGRALTLCELQAAFPGVKAAGAIAKAVESLKFAKLVRWTDQGWLRTDYATWCVLNRASLRFSTGRVRP